MTRHQIIAERWAEIQALSLKKGSHKELEDEFCVMEATAYVAGEPWSDHPKCACPVITKFMISWNDSLPTDADRDRLTKSMIPRLVGSKSTPEVESRRSYLALDWLIRVHTPQWLDLVPSLHEHAMALRALDEIVDVSGVTAVESKVRAARDASSAARSAAETVAEVVVRHASWPAAWSAARVKLKPMVEWLQTSALDLVDRTLSAQP